MNEIISIDVIEKELNRIGREFLDQVTIINIRLHTEFSVVNKSPVIPSFYYDRAFCLDNCIRESLINESLFCLFNIFNYNPKKSKGNSRSALWQSVERYESVNDFEFCFLPPSSTRPTAIRYSPLTKKTDVRFSRVLQINWSTEDRIINNHNNKSSHEVISVQDLFDLYFPSYDNRLYRLFISTLQKYAKIANNLMNFDTFPVLTASYSNYLKKEIQETLETWELKYYGFDEEKRETEITSIIRNISLLSPVLKHCLETKRYMLLLGDSDFSKCFITAEYLFRIFGNREHTIEFTSIICEYIKCIEELLHHCLLLFYDSGNYNAYCKQVKNTKLKCLKLEYESGKPLLVKKGKSDITINDMQKWLGKCDEAWNEAWVKDNVCKLLENYYTKTRNSLLHKDNIYVFQDVSLIRQNSITLSLLILGSLNFPNTIDNTV